MSYEIFQKVIFYFFMLCFVTAGLHHLYEYFYPELRPDYPPLRHLIMLGINLGLSVLMIKRTKYFLPFLLLLSIQQLYGHGGNIIKSWYGSGQALYTDWAVVIVVPFLFIAYTYDVLQPKN